MNILKNYHGQQIFRKYFYISISIQKNYNYSIINIQKIFRINQYIVKNQ